MTTAPTLAAKGTLYLVPTPLDFGCDAAQACTLDWVLPARTIAQAARLEHWITENAKSTRAFLKRVDAIQPLSQPLQAMHIQELPRELHKKGDFGHPAGTSVNVEPLLAPALSGMDVGLVSEAGMPAVADPGALVVRAAHKLGIPVCALVGPSSLLLALASSGLNGQQFAFCGYLPVPPDDRVKRIRALEDLATRHGQTQMLIETPYRNEATLKALLHTLKPSTRLAAACGLTLNDVPTSSWSGTVADWRQRPPSLNMAWPCVFMIGT